MLGRGEWRIFVAERGGRVIDELPYASFSCERVLDDSAAASVTLASAAFADASCCELVAQVEPWVHELSCYRDGVLAWTGPILDVIISADAAVLNARDLFAWLDRRFIADTLTFFGADLSVIFESIFTAVMTPDLSPNITLDMHPSAISGDRTFEGSEFIRAADALRELARTALDFTTIARTLHVSGEELSFGFPPILLHDEGIVAGEVRRDGLSLATDVATVGATLRDANTPVFGRSSQAVATYGLVQLSFQEPLIRDAVSAEANASARLQRLQPTPTTLSVMLSPYADPAFDVLIPGVRADVRTNAAFGCVSVVDTVRVRTVRVDVVADTDEQVTLELIPLGVTETD